MTSNGGSGGGYNIPIACTLDAIPADERSAHSSLAAQLFGQLIQEHRELADGHEFRFRLESLEALARFIANERKCCPFVNFDLAIVAGSDHLTLRMTGPAGTRELLRAELLR
jgi:hypothetical protein